MINRRGLITGLISFVAAPAIVHADSLMKVKGIKQFTLTEYNELILKPMVDVLYGSLKLDQNVLSTIMYMEDGSVAVKQILAENAYYK